MAAYDSGLCVAYTANVPGSPSPNGPAGALGPFPAVLMVPGMTGVTFSGNQVLEVIWSGLGTLGVPPTSGTFSLFAGVNNKGQAGNFVCKITPGTQPPGAGVSIGSGSTQGTDIFVGGKIGYTSLSITIPAAKLNTNISDDNAYLVFVPEDGGNGVFICQLTGNTA